MVSDIDPKKERKTKAVETFLNQNPDKRSVKNDFIELFALCEIECKYAILDHWHCEGKKIDVNDIKSITLHPQPIINSLGEDSYYGFSEDILLRLFGGKDNKHNPYKTKGIYSAKMLRDKISHELSISAINEVWDRKEELFNLMNNFKRVF